MHLIVMVKWKLKGEGDVLLGGILPGLPLLLTEMCVGDRTASDLTLMKNSFGIQRYQLAGLHLKKQVDSPRSRMI